MVRRTSRPWQVGLLGAGVACLLLLLCACSDPLVMFAGSVVPHASAAKDAPTAELKDITPQDAGGNVIKLDIALGESDFSITSGDVLRVETNDPYVHSSFKNGTLTIQEENHHNLDKNSNQKTTLTLPSTLKLQDVSASLGMGSTQIDQLTAQTLSLELGQGSAQCNQLTVTSSTKIEQGLGTLNIKSGELHNLSLELGSGKLNMTGSLPGDAHLEVGMGTLQLHLANGLAPYSLTAEKGMGHIKVKDASAAEQSLQKGITLGKGPNHLHLEAGMGSITVS